MLNTDTVAAERREGTRHSIDKFVDLRSSMLSQYWRVAGLKPFSTEEDTITLSLKDFCEVLMDYIAAGHFTLYERIATGTERRQRVRDLADRLYPEIIKLTDVAVIFNDKYEAQPGFGSADLEHDLSTLGEAIASRIELEDQLIQSLCNR